VYEPGAGAGCSPSRGIRHGSRADHSNPNPRLATPVAGHFRGRPLRSPVAHRESARATDQLRGQPLSRTPPLAWHVAEQGLRTGSRGCGPEPGRADRRVVGFGAGNAVTATPIHDSRFRVLAKRHDSRFWVLTERHDSPDLGTAGTCGPGSPVYEPRAGAGCSPSRGIRHRNRADHTNPNPRLAAPDAGHFRG
jgi:hypothetical protein